MMSRFRESHRVWFFAAIIAPLIIVGALLGTGSAGDQALERVPVALVNNDELITDVDEEGEETFFLASKPLVSELVTNEGLAFDWVITSTELAEGMLARGEVYAVVEIPAEFSKIVQSLDSDDPQQAAFTIKTDPSRSYLAGVLAEALGESIASGISAEFGKTLTEGLFTVIVDLGDAITQAADAAEELKEGTEALREGARELNDGVVELNDGVGELATGYGTFDDGLNTYLDGVRSLSQGLDTFESETRGLSDLGTGITQYTQGVAGISAGLQAFDNGCGGCVPADLLAGLSGLSTSGSTLSAQANTALTGVRSGIVEINKGADALSTSAADIAKGSGDIRSGLTDLSSGTKELSDGVGEFAEGIEELDDGVGEFADGLREGSDELAAENISVPSDQTLTALTNPIVFESEDYSGALGLQATLAGVFIPIGLWFVSLVYFVMTPTLTSRIFSGTLPTTALMGKTLRPLVAVVLGQTAVVTLLFHALGGVAWSHLGWTLLISSLSALAFSSAHYLVWVWRPRFLVPFSLTLAIIQVVTLGNIIPMEILPTPYQLVAGLTPVSWSTDAFIASVYGEDLSRVIVNLVALVGLLVVSLVLARIALAGTRRASVQEQLGVVAHHD
jgi:putative membrane protein